MAQQEHDREDLLREATALVERAEFLLSGDSEPVVVGFRRDGATSVFLGFDPVYQFNKDDQLRRAYRHGFLIKAERERLVRLSRTRTDKAVELLRHEMTDEEHHEFIGELVRQISELRNKVQEGRYRRIGEVPQDANVMLRIQTWLNQLKLPPDIASTPRVGGTGP